MRTSRALGAMLLAALLAGGAGWLRERSARRLIDRELMVDGYRAVPVVARGYELLPLRPGDRVDVLVVFDAAVRSGTRKFSATILQNAEVLGTARSGALEGKGVAYLLLNPIEAQYAALSARQGDLSIVLRKPGDLEIHPVEMADFTRLFR